jgi:hypothetical protein
MPTASTLALRIERYDGAYGFDDPAVPAALTVEELTTRAAPRLRYPSTDVSSGKPLAYSLLHDGAEVPKTDRIGDALPNRARVFVVHEYRNARAGDGDAR